MPEKVLTVEDARHLAQLCVGVLNAHLSRAPRAEFLTVGERETIERLRQALAALDRETVVS